MPPQDTNPTPSFGGFGLTKIIVASCLRFPKDGTSAVSSRDSFKRLIGQLSLRMLLQIVALADPEVLLELDRVPAVYHQRMARNE